MDNLETRLQRIQSKLKAGGFSLNPSMTEAEIESYEQRHQIRLPEGYRLFLREAGNGGAGPSDDGLVPLEDAAKLDEPFPTAQAWTEEMDLLSGMEASEEWEDYFSRGYLRLGTSNDWIGDWILIVCGAAKGQVWMFCHVGVVPCVPARDFLSWYEHWLDKEAEGDFDQYRDYAAQDEAN